MPRLFAILLLAAALLAGAPVGPAAAATHIQVKSRVVVSDSVVRLGDLFDGLGERGEIPVGRAPDLGQRIELGTRWLTAVAQAYAVAWRPRSRFDTITITRASQVIGTPRIEDAMREALSEMGVARSVSLLLDNTSLQLLLPTGARTTMKVAGLSYDPGSGRFAAQVIAPAEGTPVARATVSGRVVEMTKVPVLSRRVEPGEIIRKSDIEWLPMRADRIGRNAILELGRLLGKSPRRPMRAGRPILSADLREPILVAKGSLVTIRLETERMVLTAQGRALEQGAAGDGIRVANTKSNAVITATVVRAGLVRVVPAALAGLTREDLR